MLTRDEQTIIAQCTPQGSGALALLRLSGKDALTVATKLTRLSSKQTCATVATHTVHHGYIIAHDGNIIDEVLCTIMHGPRTFTGQDTVEITCHNNQFIIQDALTQAIACGARIAEPGEFTQRAFLHKKIDLIQAEAINDLIHAQTPQALKHSLAQVQGSLSHWITAIEKELVKALAWTEASFEFLDDEGDFSHQISDQLTHLQQTITQIKNSYNHQKHIRQGFKIALIGSVNAGKSSLFNALIGQQRAIVTAQAGTTRDSIEASIYKKNGFWTLVDTAGLRQTDDFIEQEGIKRSHQEAHTADCILLVYDSSRALSDEEASVYASLKEHYAHKCIAILNKCDVENPLLHTDGIAISAHNKSGLTAVEQALEQKLAALTKDTESPYLLNQRQHTLLEKTTHDIAQVLTLLQKPTVHYELVSYHLKDVLENLSSLTGKSVSEQGLDMVFKEFCVGK